MTHRADPTSPTFATELCGTYAGYARHHRADPPTKPCIPCLDAHNLKQKIRRIQNGETQTIPIDVLSVYAVLCHERLFRQGVRRPMHAALGVEVAQAVLAHGAQIDSKMLKTMGG